MVRVDTRAGECQGQTLLPTREKDSGYDNPKEESNKIFRLYFFIKISIFTGISIHFRFFNFRLKRAKTYQSGWVCIFLQSTFHPFHDVAVPWWRSGNYRTHKVVPSAQGGPSDAKLFQTDYILHGHTAVKIISNQNWCRWRAFQDWKHSEFSVCYPSLQERDRPAEPSSEQNRSPVPMYFWASWNAEQKAGFWDGILHGRPSAKLHMAFWGCLFDNFQQ